MGNRWHMHRMGFVNFWLYDEEIFTFADGKLLLRGQNGSGKSITTQSFIPFILDGDRTPSRLDPFGSSDRRMEYYFLGDGDREEATGYLFLEFKREGVEQYRTIGIGQRAQKGKPMSFWGFVILDGRRIGEDMRLYREVGTSRIPLTKKELKDLLGPSNLYTESQKEYMEAVNQHLFGFPSVEQYNQFIKLLVKVRAPKLSKEFKPSRVYEILNDALPTLSDEDMRAMVEAMEKMDEIQSCLESMRDAFRDTQIIRNEYTRYNAYILGKKAQAYLKESQEEKRLRLRLEEKESENEEKKADISRLKEEERQLESEESILKKEQDVLHIEDLDQLMNRLEQAQQAGQNATAEQRRLKERIEEGRGRILQYDGRRKACENQIEYLTDQMEKCLDELREYNEALQLQHHEVLSHKERREVEQVRNELRQLLQTVKVAYEALKDMARLEARWSEETEALQQMQQKMEELTQQSALADQMEAECRDRLIEAFYRLQVELRHMQITKEQLFEITERIRAYQEPGDVGKIQTLYHQSWIHQDHVYREKKMLKEHALENCLEEMQTLEEEIARIKAQKMVPTRDARREKARKRLEEKGIAFVPFYEAVDFAEGLETEQKNRIEAQLRDAGILDALVISRDDADAMQEEWQTLSDVLLVPCGERSARYSALCPAKLPEALRERTEEILDCFSEDRESAAGFVLSPDGYFRHGVLEGHVHEAEEASYVGAAARENARLRLLREREEERAQKEREQNLLREELREIEKHIEELRQEYAQFPSFEDLNQGIDLVRDARYRIENQKERLDAQERQTDRAQAEYKQAEQKVMQLCRGLPYRRSLGTYQEIIEAGEGYRDSLENWESHLNQWENERNQRSHIEELIERESENQEQDYEYLRRAERAMAEAHAQVQKIQEELNRPDMQKNVERVREIRERLAEILSLHQRNISHLAVLQSDVARLENEIQETQQIWEIQQQRRNLAEQYFVEERDLKQGSGAEGTETLEAQALKAQRMIREGDRERSGTEMTMALVKTFQSHMGTLTGYGCSMEECFAPGELDMLRTRQRIAFVWKGQRLYLEEFYTVLQEAIESTELLIQQKDRELFEGILADTLSRKLSNRIRQSRGWIRDMSALMREMDTSMALTFSLEWYPRSAEGEGELDTLELEKILSRDRELLTDSDIEKVSAHFRNKIHTAKELAAENGEIVNYMELVRDALDYRKWFEFRMHYYRKGENRRELTNGAFNRFSGGEKAMAMYVPLFAAVNAQYRKAEHEDHPRVIALDEAFAGVDDKNISSMFELVESLDFDYIMNSQVLWGCYETVSHLRIAELLRPAGTDVVTVIFYDWNGKERVLYE